MINGYKSLKENNIKDDNLVVLNGEKEKIQYFFIYQDKSKIEKNELNKLACKLKEETQIDVIISAENTENLLTLQFKSYDQSINCYVLCNENDKFNNIVNKVYEQKPEFKEQGNYFLCKGNKINEYKSLLENNIEDRDVIILCE